MYLSMCGPPTRKKEGLVHIWSAPLRNHQRKSENQEVGGSSFLFFCPRTFSSFPWELLLFMDYMSMCYYHVSSFLIFFWKRFLFICLSSSVLILFFYRNNENSTCSIVISLSYYVPPGLRLIDIKPSPLADNL